MWFTLAFYVLAALTLVGWVAFWMASIELLERVLKPIFGRVSLSIALVGFPFLFFVAIGIVLDTLGNQMGGWLLVTLGACLPPLGLWSIRSYDR